MASTEELQHEIFCSVRGTWTEQLSFGDIVYWRYDAFQPLFPSSLPISASSEHFVLPSDSRVRPDIIALHDGDKASAQAAKANLEQSQRADRKLRDSAPGGSISVNN